MMYVYIITSVACLNLGHFHTSPEKLYSHHQSSQFPHPRLGLWKPPIYCLSLSICSLFWTCLVWGLPWHGFHLLWCFLCSSTPKCASERLCLHVSTVLRVLRVHLSAHPSGDGCLDIWIILIFFTFLFQREHHSVHVIGYM